MSGSDLPAFCGFVYCKVFFIRVESEINLLLYWSVSHCWGPSLFAILIMVSAFSIPIAKLALVTGALISAITALPAQALPTVDLGYAIHRPTLNSSGQFPYLNFSNIRFAQPPVGDLRFSAPLPPKGRNRTINDGQHGAICPQASPAWSATAGPFLALYLTGQNISNYTNPPHTTTVATNSSSLSIDPSTSEDCLFLDVIVPQKIFNSTRNPKKGKLK